MELRGDNFSLQNEKEFTATLLRIFDEVLITEEKALSHGYFSDLSIAELHTLDAIGPYDSPTMSQTAQNLNITTGTLTVAIDRLLKKGYVERHRDEKDRRIVRLYLTKRGKLAYRMHNRFHTLLAKRIMEPLDRKEQKLLVDLVERVHNFICEQKDKYTKE